ncbi:MAG: sigma-70 family RNA polymerase sigma factor [Actinomycetota bacterium]|nr:sigma-70 family RNA polymerase sigma factor [Actinomycetota bacterium]
MDRSAPAAEENRKAAFGRYVLPEIDVLYRVALSLVDSPADAEDLVQDTLLRAYRGLSSFDGRHPRAWLLTILRNAHLNRFRRRRPGLLREPDSGPEGGEADEAPGPEAMVVDASFDAAVVQAVQALSDKMRSVLQLVDIDGLSYQEAAAALGVPVGTVMSRLHRARARIREDLAVTNVARRST